MGARQAFLRVQAGTWGKDRLPGKFLGVSTSQRTQKVTSGAFGPGDTVLPLLELEFRVKAEIQTPG